MTEQRPPVAITFRSAPSSALMRAIMCSTSPV
jgi:hypothetical protein